jgi:hypothetical protein
MATPDNVRNQENLNTDQANGEQQSSVPFDLPDSAADREKLQPENTVINLPDVSDIPGQENITVPQMGEFADTTISSDDEEGTGIFGQDAGFDDATARTAESEEDRNLGGNVVEGTP